MGKLKQSIFKGYINGLLIALFVFFAFRTSAQQASLSVEKIDSISIFFDYNSYEIKSVDSVTNIIFSKNLNDTKRLIIKGYSDAKGTQSYNYKLTSQRISAFLDLLKKCNVKIEYDTINLNEMNDSNFQDDDMKRRLDVFIYEIDTSMYFDKPILLKINFEGSSLKMTQSSIPELEKLKKILKSNPNVNIEILGHTCCHNDVEFSLKRAYQVRLYLINNGIAKDRIVCKGMGNSKPLASDKTEEGMNINRRVEVVFLKQ